MNESIDDKDEATGQNKSKITAWREGQNLIVRRHRPMPSQNCLICNKAANKPFWQSKFLGSRSNG